jgi:uncharacterized lipoprotein YddW (UPF0748 family)
MIYQNFRSFTPPQYFRGFTAQKTTFFFAQIRPLAWILGLLFFQNLSAQITPKREMRGVWIATVLNIDFPATATADSRYLADTWVQLIDRHKALGINTLYVQIRPAADALYPSSIVPWSRFLTGQSDVPPADGFDPLAFMIETAHQRGMEFHAWLNPYRVSMDNQGPASFSDRHVLNQHPDWCILYNKRYILNPGLPQVRQHINEVVAEIVSKYKVDAIHFDDYFYPYKNGNEAFNDYSTYKQYGSGFSTIEDWRRDNVDQLIYGLRQTMKRINPRVQFGISPFGVWRNRSRDPEGSDTQAGITCYDDLYADVRKWCRNGWIDYVVPQVYWTLDHPIANHYKIVKWWSENSANVPIYIGHGAYRVGQGSGRDISWNNPNETPRQIQLSRNTPNVKGSVYFSSKSLMNNPLGLADSMRYNYYSSPALTPEVIKDTSLLACEPPELRGITSEGNGRVLLRWKASQLTKKKIPFQYVVYRFPLGRVDFNNGKNIIAIIPNDGKPEMTFFDQNPEDTHLYAVTVTSCIGTESPTDVIAPIGYKPPVSTPSVTGVPINNKPVKVPWWKSFWRRVFGK